MKYRWTYVDDRGRWYLRSKSYYSFGTTLHRVLQRFHDAGDHGVQTVHQAVAAMEESWIDAGYSSAQEMQEALGEGKAMISAHVERMMAEPTTAATLYLEKQLRLDLGDFDLIGRVDRVDETSEGILEIIDYKTGRQTVTQEDVSSDLAMSCYALLLSSKHPHQRVCASILALRSGEKATHEFTLGELEELRRDLVLLGEEILNREYNEMAPVWKPICSECDFLPLCRKHPDFEESTDVST